MAASDLSPEALAYLNAGGTLRNNEIPTEHINSSTIAPSSTPDYTTPNYPPSPGFPYLNALSPAEQNVADYESRIRSLNDTLAGKSTFTLQQEQNYGKTALAQTITDLSGKLLALQSDRNNIPLQGQQQAEGRGITAGGLAPLTAGALRENAIQANIVSAQLDAAKGNLSTAQYKIDNAVNAQYAPLEAELKAKMDNLALLMKDPQLTLDEKNRADAQAAALRNQEAQIANDKQTKTDIWNTSVTAAQNVNSFTPTEQYPTATIALRAMQQAGTKEEALSIAAATGLTKQVKTAPTVIGNATEGYRQWNEDTQRWEPITGMEPKGGTNFKFTINSPEVTQFVKSIPLVYTPKVRQQQIDDFMKAGKWLKAQPGFTPDDVAKLQTDPKFISWVLNHVR